MAFESDNKSEQEPTDMEQTNLALKITSFLNIDNFFIKEDLRQLAAIYEIEVEIDSV